MFFLLKYRGEFSNKLPWKRGPIIRVDRAEGAFGEFTDAVLALDPQDHRILFRDKRAADLYGLKGNGREFYSDILSSRHSENSLKVGIDRLDEHRLADGGTALVEVAVCAGEFRGREVLILALKKEDERRIKEREAALRKRVIDSTYNGIGIVQRNEGGLKLIDANPALVEILELPEEEVLGASFSELLEEIPEGELIRQRMMEGESWTGEIRTDGKLGERSYQLNIDPIKGREGGVPFFALVCQDVTERKASEERLLDAVIHTQKKERKRMANDLHDGVGQKLTAANVYLKAMEKKWKKGWEDRSLQHLPMVGDLVVKALEEIRGISRDLMPNPLREYGLEEAIRQMVRDLDQEAMGTELKFTCDLKEGRTRDEKVEKAMYRASQEMLNNAIRHAEASHVELTLEEEDNETFLEIKDDGKGFRPSASERGKGSGVSSMKERMLALGGDCVVDSAPGKGTRISVRIPSEVRGQGPQDELLTQGKGNEGPSGL